MIKTLSQLLRHDYRENKIDDWDKIFNCFMNSLSEQIELLRHGDKWENEINKCEECSKESEYKI